MAFSVLVGTRIGRLPVQTSRNGASKILIGGVTFLIFIMECWETSLCSCETESCQPFSQLAVSSP